MKLAASAIGAASDVANKIAASPAGTLAKVVVPAPVQHAASEVKEKAKDKVNAAKKKLAIWLKRKLQSQVLKRIDHIPILVKDYFEDPDMPRRLSKAKDDTVDMFWPDIKSEIMWELAVALDAAKDEGEYGDGCWCFRAYCRYHLYPYEKTFWGALRHPLYLAGLIVPCIPVYGCYPLWYAFVFFVIDKSDEYQLVQYILRFKGYAFWSQGLFRAIYGYTLFLVCVTAPADEAQHNCERWGPGALGQAWPTAFGLVFQVVFVWLAFVLIRWSKKKGQRDLRNNLERPEEEGKATQRGGFIVYLLYYDLAAAVICALLLGCTLATRPEFDWDDWTMHHMIFTAQVVYGLLSMPFFLFTMPVLQQALVHARQTGYDEKGRCRPVDIQKRRPPQLVEGELLTEDEVAELYLSLKDDLFFPTSTRSIGSAVPVEPSREAGGGSTGSSSV